MAGDRGGISVGAVAGGWLAGVVTLVMASLILGLAIWRLALSPGTQQALAAALQGLAAVVAGWTAGRRSAGSGLVHGLLAGLALALALGALDGVRSGLPGWADLARTGTLLAGGGALGGVLGVNLAR